MGLGTKLGLLQLMWILGTTVMPIRVLRAGQITPKTVPGDVRLGTTSQHQTFTSREPLEFAVVFIFTLKRLCCHVYDLWEGLSLKEMQSSCKWTFFVVLADIPFAGWENLPHQLNSPFGTSVLQVRLKPPPNHLVFIRFSFCLIIFSQGWSPSLLKFWCEFAWSCSSTLFLFPYPVFSPSEAAYISLQLPFFLAHRVIFLQHPQFSSLSSQIPIMGPARATSHRKIYLKPPQ